MKEIIERNERGQVTHSRNIHGFEEWCEYDASGSITYYRNCDGRELGIPRQTTKEM